MNQDTVYRPDVAVVCSDPGEDYIVQVPCFICEILSDSTREKDQQFKRKVYESLGVRYYLIADPDDRSLLLLELVDGQYKPLADGEQALNLSDSCRIKLQLNSVFVER